MCKKRFTAFLILILCISMMISLISACSDTVDDDVEENDLPPESNDQNDINVEYSSADDDFSIYFDEDGSVNPYYGTNIYNDSILGLVYEGLFTVNNSFEAVPVLCDSWETSNGVSWTFTIKSGVTFHNGAELTVDDVVYSFRKALEEGKYSSRLSQISSVTKKDSKSLGIVLKEPNYSLPLRLDVPIVQYDTAWKDEPEGTGPYELIRSESGSYLRAYAKYRDLADIPIDRIELIMPEKTVSEAFSSGLIDLVECSEEDINSLNIHMDCEIRTYDTSTLLYLAFNTESGVFSSQPVRAAIGALVDIDYICSTIYENNVRKAPFILSSALTSCYDMIWEDSQKVSPYDLANAIADCGMEDTDGDGYLEIDGENFKITVVVNSESSKKVSAAQKITIDLQSYGIETELSILPWEDYISALENGDFSLYLGETRFTSDFDVTDLFTEDGSMNYGKITGEQYETLISDFLGAADDSAKKSAAKNLCEYVKLQSAVIPIAYKRGAVITHIDAVSGIEPSQSNIFYGITDWTVKIK